MSVSFDFSILEETRDKLLKDLQEPINDLVIANGLNLHKKILTRTPVRTGTLIAGWDLDIDFDNRGWAFLSIKNDVTYATYVENGTDRFEGRFMAALSFAEVDERMERQTKRFTGE